jgi:type I restriction enzyme R subunit
MNLLNEDNLVQVEAATFFQQELGWESVFAYNEETFGPEGTLGRSSEREVYLLRNLRQALHQLNPGLPSEACEAAIRQLTETRGGHDIDLRLNREKYMLFKRGVVVEYRSPAGELETKRLRVFNFTEPASNHFLVVRELKVSGAIYNRRPDIIGFVNGIPLLFIELKNVNKHIKDAYSDNFTDYKNTIPHLFDANARDFVTHYTTQWESGKAMFVCIDKVTTVRMYNLIQKYWQEKQQELQQEREASFNEKEMQRLKAQIEWMQETKMAVVVSDEQNEVERFKKWGLDIIPHRTLMKLGFEVVENGKKKSVDLETAFKRDEHPFRVAFVCAMWLTGFDVPSLSTLYLDKPLKAHTLMQAIARANRVHEGKNNGLIVDYCGILKSLREALATFATGTPAAGTPGEGGPETKDPVKPDPELLNDLAESIRMLRAFLLERGFELDKVHDKSTTFSQAAAILEAKEIINQSEETRKHFEILAREVFKKFKACLTLQGVLEYRAEHDAVNVIYSSLQSDKEKADISTILQELHLIVDEAVEPVWQVADEGRQKLYDISKIDFNRLKEEFAKSKKRNTTVQNLKTYVEQKLAKMMRQNPLRTDFYKRYQEIISDYNYEKDRHTIEETFERLMRFMQDLSEEEKRAAREGLNQEHLALFDQLQKPNLTKADRERIKKVSKDLLEALKANKERYNQWREKEASQADIRTFIYNYLWDENKGLPASFTPEEIQEKSNQLYGFIFDHYPSFDRIAAA